MFWVKESNNQGKLFINFLEQDDMRITNMFLLKRLYVGLGETQMDEQKTK